MTIEDVTARRQRFTEDLHRPRYHYLPPSGWMNDPNGVIQWDGRYHLFYQYNPTGAYHANIVWGHAVSDDLIHWEDLPIALRPTPDSVDEGGIFSGSVVRDGDTAKIFYTGVNPSYTIQKQCLAVSHDGLITWEKHANNPIIGTVPSIVEQNIDFRDPFVWHQNGTWYMVLGSRVAGVGGAVLLYRSPDLLIWEFLHTLMVGDIARSGVVWECPNFFPIGDKWVLIVSAHTGYATGTVLYFVGTFKDLHFIPEVEGVLDGGYYYAPLTHLDSNNHRIMYGWIREGRSDALQKTAEWSGLQAIPRIVGLDSKNRLTMQPVPELAQLRGTHYVFDGASLESELLPVKSTALEIRASFTVKDDYCGLVVASSMDGEEQTRILYDRHTSSLRVKREYAHLIEGVDVDWQGITHPLDEGETLDLHILLDGSVLEIIANGRTSLTSRIYAENADSQHVRVINPAAVISLELWEMLSIW